MRHAALGLAIALAVAGCAGPKPPPLPVEEGIDPGAPVGRAEPAVRLPPFPKDQDLIRVDVRPRTALEFFVDSTSISLPGEEIVRFTVVARSSTATNVSYEGFTCLSREHKVYARANRDGVWLPAKDAGWAPISDRTTTDFHRQLYWNYFCPGKHAISRPREGVDALRLGGHPNARPEGTMTY
jgi:hypothetical protein